jgi:hypothetical protein
MKLNHFLYSGCISIAMIVSAMPAVAAPPAVAAAAQKCACVPGKPTAASYTYDFRSEANTIFADIELQARQSLTDADALQGGARAGLTWESQTVMLDNLKSDINDIGVKLCRLETIRGVLAPWQQRVVDRIAASSLLLADNAQDAIQFGNANQQRLWRQPYRDYVNNLFNEAQRLKQSAGQAVDFASVSRKYEKEVKSL